MTRFLDVLGLRRKKRVRLQISLNVDLQVVAAEQESYLGFRTVDFGIRGMGIRMNERDLQRVWADAQKEINAIIRIPPDYQRVVRVVARLEQSRQEEEHVLTEWEFVKPIGDAKKRIHQYMNSQGQ